MKSKKSNSILPRDESDNPDQIIKKDKKILSIVMIMLFVLVVINLIIGFAAAIDNAVAERGSVAMVFIVIFGAVIDILLVIVMVSVAHNMSRTTAAVLKIAENILEAKPLSYDTEITEQVLNNTTIGQEGFNKENLTTKAIAVIKNTQQK